MSNEELDRLEKLAQAATPGPWYAHATDDQMFMNARYVGLKKCDFRHDGECGLDIDDPDDGNEIICITLLQSPPLVLQDACDENTMFIAASREAVPALVAEVRRLRAEPEVQK